MNRSPGMDPPSEPLPRARAFLGDKGFSETLTCLVTHCHWPPRAAIVPELPSHRLHSSGSEMRRKDHETCCLSELHPQAYGARLGDSFRDEKGFLEVIKSHQDQLRLIIKSHGKSTVNQKKYSYSMCFGNEHKGPKFNFP